MQKPLGLIAVGAISILVALPGAAVENGNSGKGAQNFSATLTGANEVPSVATDARGAFKLQVNRTLTEGRFELTVRDGERITMAHLHCAPLGQNGPVVVWLAGTPPPTPPVGWNVDGKWVSNTAFTNADIIPPVDAPTCPLTITNIAELVSAIRQGSIYVNVHSRPNPSGVIRGQLKPNGRD